MITMFILGCIVRLITYCNAVLKQLVRLLSAFAERRIMKLENDDNDFIVPECDAFYAINNKFADKPIFGNRVRKLKAPVLKIKMNFRGKIFSQEDLITYNLPRFVLNMRWEDMGYFINSVSDASKNSHDPIFKGLYYEMKKYWNAPNGEQFIINFVQYCYGNNRSSHFQSVPHSKVFGHHEYVAHPEMYLDEVPQEGDKDVDYMRTPIMDFVSKATKKTSYLTVSKIKSILRSSIALGKSREQIHAIFRKHMPVCETLDPYNMAWVVPFISYEYLSTPYFMSDVLFYRNFKHTLQSLRQRIFNFIDVHIELSYLTPGERKKVLNENRISFIKIMRSPEIQKLFLQGLSVDEVKQHVYDNYYNKIRSNSMNSNYVKNNKKHRLKARALEIRRQRFNKYDVQPEFMGAVIGTIGIMASISAYFNALAAVNDPSNVRRYYYKTLDVLLWPFRFLRSLWYGDPVVDIVADAAHTLHTYTHGHAGSLVYTMLRVRKFCTGTNPTDLELATFPAIFADYYMKTFLFSNFSGKLRALDISMITHDELRCLVQVTVSNKMIAYLDSEIQNHVNYAKLTRTAHLSYNTRLVLIDLVGMLVSTSPSRISYTKVFWLLHSNNLNVVDRNFVACKIFGAQDDKYLFFYDNLRHHNIYGHFIGISAEQDDLARRIMVSIAPPALPTTFMDSVRFYFFPPEHDLTVPNTLALENNVEPIQEVQAQLIEDDLPEVESVSTDSDLEPFMNNNNNDVGPIPDVDGVEELDHLIAMFNSTEVSPFDIVREFMINRDLIVRTMHDRRTPLSCANKIRHSIGRYCYGIDEGTHITYHVGDIIVNSAEEYENRLRECELAHGFVPYRDLVIVEANRFRFCTDENRARIQQVMFNVIFTIIEGVTIVGHIDVLLIPEADTIMHTNNNNVPRRPTYNVVEREQIGFANRPKIQQRRNIYTDLKAIRDRLLVYQYYVLIVFILLPFIPHILFGWYYFYPLFWYPIYHTQDYWFPRFWDDLRWFVGLCNVLHKAYTTYSSGEVPVTIDGMVQDWIFMVANPGAHVIDYRHKKVLTNVLIIINSVYDISQGNNESAMRHLAYFIATEPESIFKVLMGFVKLSGCAMTHKVQKIIQIDGVEYVLSDVQAQSIQDIISSFASLLAGYNITKMSDAEVRRTSSILNIVSTTQRLTNTNVNVVMTLISTVSRALYGVDPFDREYQTYVSKLLAYMKMMDHYIAKPQAEFFKRPILVRALEDYEAITADMSDFKFNEAIPLFLTNHVKTRFIPFEKLVIEAREFLHGNKDKPEAVAILFNGPAGVGKSGAAELFKHLVVYYQYLMATPEERVHMQKKFNRTMEFIMNNSKYFEGYHGQDFVSLDDFGQSEQMEDRKEEALNFIRMVNVCPMNLNMAFAGKGNVFFTSKYILATTNLFPNGVAAAAPQLGITCNDAFFRRFAIIVRRNETIVNRNVDMASLPWLVESCPMLPQLNGQLITTNDLAKYAIILSRKKAEQLAGFTLGEEAMDRLFQMNPTVAVEADVEPPQDVPNAMEDVNQAYENILRNADAIPVPEFREDFRTLTAIETMVEFMKLRLYSWLDSEYVYYIYGAGVVILTYVVYVFFVATYFKDLTQSDKESIESESFQGYQKLKGKGKKKNVQYKMAPPFRPESKDLSVEFQNSVQKVSLSMMRFSVMIFDNRGTLLVEKAGQAIHIKDGFFLTCRHLMENIVTNSRSDNYRTRMTIRTNCAFYEFNDVEFDYIYMEPLDICVFKLREVHMNYPKESYKYLKSAQEYPELESGVPLFVNARGSNGAMDIIAVNVITSCMPTTYSSEEQTFIIKKSIRYSSRTYAGASGGMVICSDSQDRPILIGMHCGQSVSNGYSVAMPIPIELIDHMMEHIEKPPDFRVECEETNLVKTVPLSEAAFYPKRSQIATGACFNWWFPNKYKPAKLDTFTNKHGEIIDPYKVAISKLKYEFTPEVPFNKSRVVRYLLNLYPDNTKAKSIGLLSWQQCAEGIKGTNIQPVVLGTSAGYPKNLAKKKGKFDYVDFVDDKYILDDDFVAELNAHERDLIQGKQIEAIFIRMLKDELRPVEKVDEGKTRLFCAGPLHLLFLMKRYFAAFNSYLQDNCCLKPVAIGINAHSAQWQILCKRIQRMSNSIAAGDYSCYDGWVPAYVSKVSVEFINAWYDDGPINARIRELLYEHIYNAAHIHGVNVVKVCDGTSSGNFMTGVDNSIKNIIMHFIVLTEDLGLYPHEFDLTVYGDDVIVWSSRENITVEIIAYHIERRFGMKYTNSFKTAEVVKYTIGNMTFLKRNFVLDGPYVRAPLPLEEILEIVYWRKRNINMEQALLLQAPGFAVELTHHGEAVFNKYVDELKQCVKKRFGPELLDDLCRTIKTFEYYHDKMYHSEDGIPANYGVMVDRL